MDALQISLRKTTDADRDLLQIIYATTRIDELNQVTSWTAEQKAAFISHQFHAQDSYYKAQFPDADYDLILIDSIPAGRLYVNRNLQNACIHIIDITLLPEFRNKGIGTHLLRALHDESLNIGKVLSIYVEKFNPAKRLYERLGFEVKDDSNEIYQYMEWE